MADREKRFGEPPTEEPVLEYWNPPYLISFPPVGKHRVYNIYFDQPAQEQVIEYDETPIP